MNGAVARNWDFELFVQQNGVASKRVVEPELARCERLVYMRHGLVLENIADTQTFHGGVLLAEVAVEGSLPSDLCRHVLDAVSCGFNDTAVGFGDTNKLDFVSQFRWRRKT